jgi:GT2 family glycosyltransferase
MAQMNLPRVLLIVATLGKRQGYLHETLISIRSQAVPVDVVIVAPVDNEIVLAAANEFNCEVLPDPGSLAKAINVGARSLKPHHEFINWLNDDDLLEPDSLTTTIAALDANPRAVVAYGACRYIDPDGRQLWISKAGPWATRILGWGPDLIPQPGMLVRTSAWQQVGGLDDSYQLAFDLDLLLKLKKFGPLIDVGQIVSSFRWHPTSLTVADREHNIAESERAKRAALSPKTRKFTWLWEPPVRVATKVAAREVQRRATKAS